MRRVLRIESLESRTLLHGGVVVTPTSVITENDVIPRFAANAEFVAVQSGDWSNPLIWNNRTVPNIGAKVRLPHGTDITYDMNSLTELSSIEVSGRLSFKPNVETSLWVSDLMVMPDGALIVGSKVDPISSNVSAEVVFTDTPNNTISDPDNYGNGLIVFGILEVNGAAKTPYARSIIDIRRGVSTVSLDSIPVGWGVDDAMLIPETSQTLILKNERSLNESEVVSLSRVNDNQISLSNPLIYDHFGVTENSFGIERYAHVANLTRNVLFRSENPEGFRGHFIATGDAEVNVSYAQFEAMGRTRADAFVSSPMYNLDGSVYSLGSNQVGRYSLHLHHMSNPFSFDGLVVNNSLKWGIAIHETNSGIVSNSIVYDVDGAAMVTEDGSETGNQFLNNLVIKVNGGHQRDDGRSGAVEARDAQGKMFIEIGSDGSAFWMRSSAGTFVGNTVYDAAGYGFTFNGYYRMPQRGVQLHHQVELFSGNEVAASRGGLWLGVSQGQGDILGYDRQTFQDFLVWHVQSDGIRSYHDANLTFKNVTMVNSAVASNNNDGSATWFQGRANFGFWFGSASYEAFNFRMENVRVENFNVGILAPVHAGTEGAVIEGAYLRNYVNIAFEKSANPADLRYSDVIFAPSYTTRLTSAFPSEVADVWHEGRGTIKSGAQSGLLPPGVLPPLPLVVELLPDGQLRLTSGNAGDDVSVQEIEGLYKVRVNTALITYQLSKVSSIIFRGNGGNDRFDNQTSLPSLAFGGDGDDTLIGGNSVDTLLGEDGEDVIYGRGGDDLVYGGSGNDYLDGGAGRDKIYGSTGHDQLFGGSGNDWLLEGGAGDDVIYGGDGDDVISGGQGNDRVFGDSGDDNLSGGDNDDILFGGTGDDVIGGGAGDDFLCGDAGRDKLWGGDGDDELVFDLLDLVIDGGLERTSFRR